VASSDKRCEKEAVSALKVQSGKNVDNPGCWVQLDRARTTQKGDKTSAQGGRGRECEDKTVTIFAPNSAKNGLKKAK